MQTLSILCLTILLAVFCYQVYVIVIAIRVLRESREYRRRHGID